jgi:hypothetical protein
MPSNNILWYIILIIYSLIECPESKEEDEGLKAIKGRVFFSLFTIQFKVVIVKTLIVKKLTTYTTFVKYFLP